MTSFEVSSIIERKIKVGEAKRKRDEAQHWQAQLNGVSFYINDKKANRHHKE